MGEGPVGSVDDRDDLTVAGTGSKKVNAFDLINMCSGSSIGRMFQSDDERNVSKTSIVPSSKSAKEIMEILQTEFPKVPGFTEQNLYNDASKLRVVFDLGKGHVHVKITIKVAAEDPLLSMVIFKRARGDLISFGKIWANVNEISKMLV